MTFQAWKMVFLNSMTFHDQGTLLKGTLKIGERWDPAPSGCGYD